MDTRCKVCLNEAAKKCTDCGEVFCDLHIRLAGEPGGLGGLAGSVGYFCDECWEKRFKRRRTWSVMLVTIALVLLSLNILGVFAVRRASGIRPEAWLASAPIIMVLLVLIFVVLTLIAVVRRRNRP